MTRVMGPSILTFPFRGRKAWPWLFLVLFTVASIAYGQSHSVKRASETPVSSTSPMFAIPDLDFLQRAEEIEREAWWVLTEKRIEPTASPFRVFRVALLQDNPQFKTKLSLRFCRRLQVVKVTSDMWRVDSLCQKPTREVGILRKLAPQKWKVEWQMNQFESHFGLGAAIFYPKLSCEMDLNNQGRIEIMKCPLYARNRSEEEIVELNTFLYTAKGKALVKLKGEVKKDLQVVGALETEVPLAGDVVVKEKRLSQKPVEGETDFADTGASQKTDGTKGGRDHEGKVEGEVKISDQEADQEAKDAPPVPPPIEPEGGQHD